MTKTMKKIFICLVASLAAVSCISFNGSGLKGLYLNFNGVTINGEGPVETQVYELTDFDNIVVNGHFDIDFVQNDTFEVSLTTQQNIFEHINFSVDGDKLILNVVDSVKVNADKFDVKVSAPALKSVEVNGATDLSVPGGISSDGPLAIEVNGACDIDINGLKCSVLDVEINGAGDLDISGIDSDEVKIEINGAGDANLSGKTRKACFEVSGAGDIDASKLEAEDIQKNTSGLAKIKTK